MSNNCFEFVLTRTNICYMISMKEGMTMKKVIKEFGGVIFFYSVIVGVILMMNYRFAQLNTTTDESEIICIAES